MYIYYLLSVGSRRQPNLTQPTNPQAYYAFRHRLRDMVIDVGYTIQGNTPEELPEYLLGSCRMVHVDFTRHRPLPTAPAESEGLPSTPPACPTTPQGASPRQQWQAASA